MSTLWHYTTRVHLAKILQAGYLRKTPLRPKRGETPAVWFTTSDQWEPTCAKRMLAVDKSTGESVGLGLTTHQELFESMGIARIGVEDGPGYLTFEQYEAKCPEYAAHLVRAAISMTNEIKWKGNCGPGWWRARLQPVPIAEFKLVQVYDGSDREGYMWVTK